MEKIIVLEYTGKGKHCSADTVKVKLFDDIISAENHCEKVKELDCKYWTFAEIVEEDSLYEIIVNDGQL